MRIETARLLVRPFTEADAEALYAVLSDPEVMRFVEAPFSRARTEAFLREAGLCWPPRIYAVIWKPSGELIGHLIWHAWEETAMELGWILRRDFWGRGIAGEMTEALLDQTCGEIVIECSGEQRASMHIAESHGFKRAEDRDGLALYRFRGKR